MTKSKIVVNTFYEVTSAADIFECKECSAKIKQKLKSGSTNLTQHISVKHPELLSRLEQREEQHDQILNYYAKSTVSKKAKKLFEWVELVIMSNLPFAIVEDPILRKYAKMEPIYRNTLMPYLDKIGDAVRFMFYY